MKIVIDILLYSSVYALFMQSRETFAAAVGSESDSLEEIDFGHDDTDLNIQEDKYIPIRDARLIEESLRDLKPQTLEDINDPELENWNTPLALKKAFGYYLSGYDDEGRPVWIAELGKMDLRQIIDERLFSQAVLDKWIKQIAYRLFKSVENVTTPERPVDEIVCIEDADGFNLAQMAHIPTVAFVMRVVTMYRGVIIQHMGALYIINANAIMTAFSNLLRPVFRDATEKMEIFGTNKERWLPVLRSKIPLEALPSWYGGKSDYKPITVYG